MVTTTSVYLKVQMQKPLLSNPFGLGQVPTYFQQLISMVLQGCSDFMMAYLDDIIIFCKYKEEHLKHIEIIFQKLVAAGLKLKESKVCFLQKRNSLPWSSNFKQRYPPIT